MKKSELFFSFILLPLDLILINAAGMAAYFIRFSDVIKDIRPVTFYLSFDSYIKALIPLSLALIIIFAFEGLYSVKNSRHFLKEIYRVMTACSFGLFFIVILIFFRRELFDSRFIVLASWILAILFVSIGRGIVRAIQNFLYSYDIGIHKVVIVGNSKTTDNLIQEFSENKLLGFEVVKRFRDFSIETAQEIESLMGIKEVNELIQADPNISKSEVLRMIYFADEKHITFKYAADLLDAKVLKTDVSEIAGIPIIEVIKTPLEGWGRIAKRAFDIIGSLFFILLFSPVMIITALLIKLDSHGPIFFSVKDDGSPLYRVGQGGRLFKYLKFRSMIPNSDNLRYTVLADKNIRTDGPMVKIADDPRVTRIGKIIRKYSIDELPEFFLVLSGHMSLVGPRPHLPEEVAKYEHHHKKVLTIKPGITGIAQISGRSDLSFEDEVRLDTYYIENWSLLLDLAILFKTPLAIFKHRLAE